MKKKVMGLILIVSLVLTATPASKQKIMAISQSTIPSGYIGIYDADDLAGIANKPRANYILMNDIDLSETARGGTLDTGKGWKPIKEFDGVLDGNGHYIKNMNIFGVTDDDCGLFSDMQGTVKKLGLTNVNINVETEGQSSNNVYVGAIAASSGYDYGRDDSNFEQCFVTGTISVRTTKEHVNVGAFAGGGYGDHITDCYNGANISVNDINKTSMSAFIGRNFGDTNPRINRCYNVGKIQQGNGNVFRDNDYVDNSFYLSGSGNAESGSPLTSSQMKKRQYFTKFDFEKVWEIDSFHTYNYPQLKECVQDRIKKIKITKTPSKVTYYQGDALNLSGGMVELTYEDSSKITTEISSDMLGNYNMGQLGSVKVSLIKGGVEKAYYVTVKPVEVTSVALDQITLKGEPNEDVQLSAVVVPANATYPKVTWSSSNENVATVNQNGNVSLKRVGTCVISAKTSNGKLAQCKVSVEIPSYAIEIRHPDNDQIFSLPLENYSNVIVLKEGETYNCSASLSPSNSSDTVTWSSSDVDVLQSLGNGTIRAVKMGRASIRATAKSGARSSVQVFVKRDLAKCQVDPIADQIYTGKELYPKLVVRDGDHILEGDNYLAEYRTEYSNNANVGQATIRIVSSGDGYYFGETSAAFKINAPVIKTNTDNNVSQKADKSEEEIEITDDDESKDPIPPAKVKVKSVKNLKGKKLKVSWKKVKGATEYDVQIARNKKMKKGEKTKSTKKTSYTFKKMKKKVTYYVRVRACKETSEDYVEGKWSAIKKIKIKK